MSSYVVLARKWRPTQFSDLIGQNHIVRTLMNAILQERIHQAYLFTGSRGIGKTSMARIFSKVIRCEQRKQIPPPAGSQLPAMIHACNACNSCKEITNGNSVDVMEIDGASNNGVESVREIRENAKYMPSTGSRKIYIIDEVHMLSTAAFNALLKTLEEPPEHVIFIFATTEPHKIPATILSRCQRFDYRRVSVVQIQERLTEITLAEQIDAEPPALSLIAKSAEGSMRDALSLLDQMVAYAGSTLTLQHVREGLGLIEGKTSIQILKTILEKNPLEALKIADEVFRKGQDLRILVKNIIEFLHTLLLVKIESPLPQHLEILEEEWKELQSLKNLRSIEELELLFQVLHHSLELIAKSSQPKIVLDVILIKCATAEALISIHDPKPSSTPLSHPSSPSSVSTTGASTPGASTFASPSPAAAPPLPQETQKATQQPAHIEDFINSIRKTRPLLASILEHASLIDLPSQDQPLIKIYYLPHLAYFKEQLQSKIYQEQLSSLSRQYFGNFIRIQVELKDAGESLAAKKQRKQQARVDEIKEKAQIHPIILEAKSLFGGELGPIHITEGNHADLST